jgi:hypothetical protein
MNKPMFSKFRNDDTIFIATRPAMYKPPTLRGMMIDSLACCTGEERRCADCPYRFEPDCTKRLADDLGKLVETVAKTEKGNK